MLFYMNFCNNQNINVEVRIEAPVIRSPLQKLNLVNTNSYSSSQTIDDICRAYTSNILDRLESKGLMPALKSESDL